MLDEASQVQQAGAYYLLLRKDGHELVAGDPRQLGPIYELDGAGTEGGLLDNVFDHDQEACRLPDTALNFNYRTCEEVAAGAVLQRTR